ncbi:MAG: hypothetical protein KTR31_24530 [Myxococcales bacterium]|nr:hypothetical protein [Myxococcales bacterium]
MPDLLARRDFAGLRRRLLAGTTPPHAFPVALHVVTALTEQVGHEGERAAERLSLLADLVAGPYTLARDPLHWDGGRGTTACWGQRVPHGLQGRRRTLAGQLYRAAGRCVSRLVAQSPTEPDDDQAAAAAARLLALYPQRRGVVSWLRRAAAEGPPTVAAAAVFALGFQGRVKPVLAGLRRPSPVREVATLCAVRLGARPVGRAMALQRRRISGYDTCGVTSRIDDDVGAVVAHVSTNLTVMSRLRAPEAMARALMSPVLGSGPVTRPTLRQRTFLRAVADLNLHRALSAELAARDLPAEPEALRAMAARRSGAPRSAPQPTARVSEQSLRFERMLVEAAALRARDAEGPAEEMGWALVEENVLDVRAWTALGLALLPTSVADAADPLSTARRLDPGAWPVVVALAVVATTTAGGVAPEGAEALPWPEHVEPMWMDLPRWRELLERAGWRFQPTAQPSRIDATSGG